MKIYNDLNHLPAFENTHLSIGSFDGVHTGHRELIRKLTLRAHKENRESVIITFHPHPRTLVNTDTGNLRLLNSIDEKVEILSQTGIQNLVITPFTSSFAEQSAQEYIEKFLIGCFHPENITIGFDHRFGKERSGGIELLKDYAQRNFFTIDEIPEQQINELKVSSTRIRQLLESGKIDEANLLLGAPYPIMGLVVKGRQQGRLLGFPTANIQNSEPLKLIPKNGVYASYVNVDGQKFKGAVNIGIKPTFEQLTPTVEVHILNFNHDIYDKKIKLELITRIRDEIEFPNLEALKNQIATDILHIQNLLT